MMLSPPGPVHEEPESLVRRHQYLPPAFIEPVRRWGRVEASKLDGQFTTVGLFQIRSTAGSMVPVGPHLLGHRQVEQIQDRGDGSSNGTRIRSPFSDIVQERSFDHSEVTRKGSFGFPRDVEGMALIRDALFPEELGARCRKMIVNVSLFEWAERPGTVVPEKPKGEVPGPPQVRRHEAALHPTQRRAAGKYSMRSGSISSPQVSQIP